MQEQAHFTPEEQQTHDRLQLQLEQNHRFGIRGFSPKGYREIMIAHHPRLADFRVWYLTEQEAMEIMHCDDCGVELEAGRIGLCDDCSQEKK